MIQERIRLGKTLTLPHRWQDALGAAEGDELTVFYDEDGILIIKDLARLGESLQAFVEMVPSSRDEYMARVAEMAAEYETSPLVEWAAEYTGPEEPMSPDLEALYLEAKREIHESHLPPLHEGTTVELPPEFVPRFETESNE